MVDYLFNLKQHAFDGQTSNDILEVFSRNPFNINNNLWQ